MKLNWKIIWEKFDKWFDKTSDQGWENQQKTIKRIINKQLKEKSNESE